MPHRCVAGGCSNVPDTSRNIGLHKFPDQEAEKSRWKAWVQFVGMKLGGDKTGKKWAPSKYSRLCSEHFRPDCFENKFISIPGTSFSSEIVLKNEAVPIKWLLPAKAAQQHLIEKDVSVAG